MGPAGQEPRKTVLVKNSGNLPETSEKSRNSSVCFLLLMPKLSSKEFGIASTRTM
jgi:hypothetical protein